MLLMPRVRVAQVDVGGRLWVFALGLDESGLEVDNIFAQRVVLRLYRLVIVLQGVELPNLLLELLDVSFLALSKGSLSQGVYVSFKMLVWMT